MSEEHGVTAILEQIFDTQGVEAVLRIGQAEDLIRELLKERAGLYERIGLLEAQLRIARGAGRTRSNRE